MTDRTQGPTPAGGDYAEAIWYDDTGLELETSDGAASVEITEFDADGTPLLRTYSSDFGGGEAPLGQATSQLDVEDQDLLKLGTWDLYVDGILTTTLDQYLLGLEVEDATIRVQRDTVAETLQLPFWQAAPEALKAEVYAWLDGIGALE